MTKELEVFVENPQNYFKNMDEFDKFLDMVNTLHIDR